MKRSNYQLFKPLFVHTPDLPTDPQPIFHLSPELFLSFTQNGAAMAMCCATWLSPPTASAYPLQGDQFLGISNLFADLLREQKSTLTGLRGLGFGS